MLLDQPRNPIVSCILSSASANGSRQRSALARGILQPTGNARLFRAHIQGQFMDKLIIEGGVPLTGVVHVSGSKNAALPILMGSILLDEPVTYTNVPDLRDIRTTFKLLELLGCPNAFENGQVTVTPGALSPEAPYELVKTMRASVLVLGPLLARLGEARVAMPGGCAIGADFAAELSFDAVCSDVIYWVCCIGSFPDATGLSACGRWTRGRAAPNSDGGACTPHRGEYR